MHPQTHGPERRAGVALAASAQHLQNLLQQPPWQDHPFVLQALVKSHREFVTHCICKNGRIIWHATYAYTLRPGEIIRRGCDAQSIRPAATSSKTLARLQRLLEPLNYTGPCNFDYKLTPEGNAMIMEANPRLGGSLMRPKNVRVLRAALSTIIENALRD